MCEPKAGEARDLAKVIYAGMAIAAVGILLIGAQLVAEIWHKDRFGPDYIGLYVLLVGAGVMAIACVAASIPRSVGRLDRQNRIEPPTSPP